MTKLDLLLARIRKLPSERQDAFAQEVDFWLECEERGSAFTDEQWAEIEKTFDEDEEEIPHEQVFAELRAKFPG